ncbi:MAG: carboxypeptidase regulatory-like domain-containing protein [Euryarchaeota archaeon]|nr:carboxypeptidase regulatory-like domain-containing protein [Euryarchaeota archaeon]
MGRSVLVALIVLLMGAGCLAEAPPAAKASPPPTASVTEDTGGVEGMVVDDEFIPVGNASLSVIGSTVWAVSNAAGAFALSGLPAGDHLLVVKAQGFKDRNQGITVLPGEVSKVRVVLEAVPGPVPYIDASYSYAGYLNVAFAASAGGQTVQQTGSSGTAVPEAYRSKNSGPVIQVKDGWHTNLFEIAWTGGTGLADQLRMRIDLPIKLATGNGYSYSHQTFPATGKSPLAYRLDVDGYEALLKTTSGLHNMTAKKGGFVFWVQPWTSSGAPVGVFADQRFTFYATTSYYEPLDPSFARTKG